MALSVYCGSTARPVISTPQPTQKPCVIRPDRALTTCADQTVAQNRGDRLGTGQQELHLDITPCLTWCRHFEQRQPSEAAGRSG